MRNTGLLLLVFSLALPSIQAQAPLRPLPNEAFKKGEILVFRVHYGFIDAGEAVLEVKDEEKFLGPNRVYHISGKGQSKGAFDWFFKVRDLYETYIDEQAIVPWVFTRRVDEGGYRFNQNYIFNPYKNTVRDRDTVISTPPGIQDMLSAFYYARCIDYSSFKEGDVLSMSGFVDGKVVPLKIRYIGKEILETDLGKFHCLKFRPVVITGRIFKHEEDLNVWVTEDKNHIPIRAEAEILVGSIKMDLTGYSGLTNPVSKAE